MIKIRLTDGLLHYRFPPQEGKHFGFDLHVLLDPKTMSALLIDTGYEEHATAVRDDLLGDGHRISMAVLSHFHPDHILGLAALPDIETLGSPRYEETLSQYGDRREWEAYIPSRIVTVDETIDFGPFQLTFLPTPGHAPCSQYTLIGDRFVHVADNVMTSHDGQDILPWAPYDQIPAHIESLEQLRQLMDRTFLLSHGLTLSDAAIKRDAIDNRIRYFQSVLEGEGTYDFDRATRGCSCEFLHSEWLIRR